MKRWNVPLLIFCILLCEGAGILGSIFTFSAIPTWYATLVKPPFSPPNWIFGPVWITLYLLMGITLYLILSTKATKKKKDKGALSLFAFQLILNVLWSVVFFGGHSPLGGLIIIVALWISILLCALQFWKISKIAGSLLIPYFLWVSFASVLNYSLYILN